MRRIVYAIFSWVPALILLQTLYFKFSAHKESVYIFQQMGMEPWGRIGSGVIELIVAIFLLIPITRPFAAFVGMGVLSGAIFFHLTSLGIVVMDDGGVLFIFAVVSFVCLLVVFIMGFGHFVASLKYIIARFSASSQ